MCPESYVWGDSKSQELAFKISYHTGHKLSCQTPPKDSTSLQPQNKTNLTWTRTSKSVSQNSPFSSICCRPRNLTDTCKVCFQNHYLIFIYKMGFLYIRVCILIYLSGITLNKIIDVMLYNEMHLCICPKIKDLLYNHQLLTINIAPNTINNNFLIYNSSTYCLYPNYIL